MLLSKPRGLPHPEAQLIIPQCHPGIAVDLTIPFPGELPTFHTKLSSGIRLTYSGKRHEMGYCWPRGVSTFRLGNDAILLAGINGQLGHGLS